MSGRFTDYIVKIRFIISTSAFYALVLILGVNMLGINIPVVYSQTPPPLPKKEIKITSGKPIRILLPRLQIDLPVSDGAFDINTGTWNISDNHVHYALPSSLANDYAGNTLIYGHSYDWVFRPLKKLSPGDTLQVFTDNGHVFNYIFEGSRELSPTDTSVFSYDGYPSVTLQTCSGVWLEKREMFKFNLEEVGA
jgi:LPXTG-site transpeptidase (sortase) family protein